MGWRGLEGSDNGHAHVLEKLGTPTWPDYAPDPVPDRLQVASTRSTAINDDEIAVDINASQAWARVSQ